MKAVRKDPLSAAQHDRKNKQAVFIHQVSLRQRMDQDTAAIHVNILPGLFLQLAYFIHYVLTDDA